MVLAILLTLGCLQIIITKSSMDKMSLHLLLDPHTLLWWSRHIHSEKQIKDVTLFYKGRLRLDLFHLKCINWNIYELLI